MDYEGGEHSMEGALRLADVLESLGAALQSAWKQGEGHVVRFGVDKLTVTLQAVAGRTVDGTVKAGWWVFGAEGSVGAVPN